jgi:hypothetical protein
MDITLADIGLAAVVGVLALVPAALAFLALAAGLRVARAEERLGPGAFRAVAGGLAAAVAVACALGAWVWGGATHLKPRCLARATPAYATTVDAGGERDGDPAPVPVASVLVDAPASAGAPPAWAAALLGPGRFGHYEWRRADGSIARVGADGTVTPVPASAAGAVLRVRRAGTSASFWAPITVDRFTLLERPSGAILAEGEEMWVDAGPARYRCGVASGPVPVAGAADPGGEGVARFVLRAAVPAT